MNGQCIGQVLDLVKPTNREGIIPYCPVFGFVYFGYFLAFSMRILAVRVEADSVLTVEENSPCFQGCKPGIMCWRSEANPYSGKIVMIVKKITRRERGASG